MKTWMREVRVTQDEVAAFLGMSREYFNRIINGKATVTVDDRDFVTDFFFVFGEEATVEAFSGNGKQR